MKEREKVESPVDNVSEPLLPDGGGQGCRFEYRNRPFRDVAWLVAYLVLMVGMVAGGIVAFANRNLKVGNISDPDHPVEPGRCPIHTPPSLRRLLQEQEGDNTPDPLSTHAAATLCWLLASVGGALLLGFLFVWLVQRMPRAMVMFALGFLVAMPAISGLGTLLGGNPILALVLLGFAALLAALFYWRRAQFELVAALMGVAGRGLSANPGLVPLALGLQLAVVALEVPLVMFAGAARANGALAYNQERIDGGAATQPDQCLDADGEVVKCCSWELDGWIKVYFPMLMISILWTVLLAFNVKVFTVAGAIAQWYFLPAAAGSSGGGVSRAYGADSAPPSGAGRGSRTLTAFRFALGPSLGSLCFSSAVSVLLALLASALAKLKRRSAAGAVAGGFLSGILRIIQYVARFGTIYASITGRSFFDAGRTAGTLLVKNFGDAVSMWWLPPIVLHLFTFVLAGVWAGVVGLLSFGVTFHGMPQAGAAAGLLALAAFLVAWFILLFLSSLLLNVIDAVFMCFVMDREAGQVSQPAVHEVYVKLPTVGAVVQQPDGDVVYGAPGQQEAASRV